MRLEQVIVLVTRRAIVSQLGPAREGMGTDHAKHQGFRVERFFPSHMRACSIVFSLRMV